MEPKKDYSWVIAIVLCIFSACFSNLGVNLQKLAWKNHLLSVPDENVSLDENRSHVSYSGFAVNTPTFRAKKTVSRTSEPSLTTPLNQPEEENSSTSWGFKALWTFGLSLSSVGAFLDFIALGFGAQSVVAPLGSLTLVFNLLFANVIHDETVEKSDFKNTFLIILGCCFSVAFSSKQTSFREVVSLFELFTSVSFMFYAITTLTLIISLLMFLRKVENNFSNLTSAERTSAEKRQRLIYPVLSGICGAQSVLFAKLLDELLLSTLASKGEFYTRGETFLVCFGLLCGLLSQVYFMNEGLRRFSALFVVPIFQSTWIVYSVIGGGVVFEEFYGFSSSQVFGFSSGVFLTVLGVFFLSERDIKNSQPFNPIETEKQENYGTLTH